MAEEEVSDELSKEEQEEYDLYLSNWDIRAHEAGEAIPQITAGIIEIEGLPFKENSQYQIFLADNPSQTSIDYFKITPDSFPWNNGQIKTHVLEQDEKGFISADLVKKVNLDESDTCVVNVGVGYGKTEGIYNIVRAYAKDKRYKVLVISPYRKLVDRDYQALYNENKHFTVVNYNDINQPDKDKVHDDEQEYRDRAKGAIDKLATYDVHILTINTLLQNPGKDNYFLSYEKSHYIDALIRESKKQGKKVVMVFDEVHAGVHHLQPQFVFHLRRWKGLVHKTFLLSATFNQAALIAIEHFAYLTNYKVSIYDCERRKRKTQATLRLHYTNQLYTPKNLSPLRYIHTLLSGSKRQGTPINIITGYKSIANGLFTYLTTRSACEAHGFSESDFNLVTGDTEKEFDPDKINIGTTFLSGVNIDKLNSTLIIIMPASYKDIKYGGIFSDGYISIHQAIGRIRSTGDVHIFSPPPTEIIDTKPNSDPMETGALKSLDEIQAKASRKFLHVIERVKYKYLNAQNEVLKKYFNDKRSRVNKEINISAEDFQKRHNKSTDLEKLVLLFNSYDDTHTNSRYISYSDFLLADASRFLATTETSYGKNFAPYILWAAFNDQFVNARLDTVFVHYNKTLIDLEEEKLPEQIEQYYSNIAGKFDANSDLNKAYQIAIQLLKVDSTDETQNIVSIDGKEIKDYSKAPKPFLREILFYLLREVYGFEVMPNFEMEDYVNLCTNPISQRILDADLAALYVNLRGLLLSFIDVVGDKNSISIDDIPGDLLVQISKHFEILQKADPILASGLFELAYRGTNTENKLKRGVGGNIELLDVNQAAIFKRAIRLCYEFKQPKNKKGVYEIIAQRKF